MRTTCSYQRYSLYPQNNSGTGRLICTVLILTQHFTEADSGEQDYKRALEVLPKIASTTTTGELHSPVTSTAYLGMGEEAQDRAPLTLVKDIRRSDPWVSHRASVLYNILGGEDCDSEQQNPHRPPPLPLRVSRAIWKTGT
jgi:hypothetical protein